MIQNLIVGIFMIFAIAFIATVVYMFTAKPKDARITETVNGIYIEVKRWFLWDSLENIEEVAEYYKDGLNTYPFRDRNEAEHVLSEIKMALDVDDENGK